MLISSLDLFGSQKQQLLPQQVGDRRCSLLPLMPKQLLPQQHLAKTSDATNVHVRDPCMDAGTPVEATTSRQHTSWCLVPQQQLPNRCTFAEAAWAHTGGDAWANPQREIACRGGAPIQAACTTYDRIAFDAQAVQEQQQRELALLQRLQLFARLQQQQHQQALHWQQPWQPSSVPISAPSSIGDAGTCSAQQQQQHQQRVRRGARHRMHIGILSEESVSSSVPATSGTAAAARRKRRWNCRDEDADGSEQCSQSAGSGSAACKGAREAAAAAAATVDAAGEEGCPKEGGDDEYHSLGSLLFRALVCGPGGGEGEEEEEEGEECSSAGPESLASALRRRPKLLNLLVACEQRVSSQVRLHKERATRLVKGADPWNACNCLLLEEQQARERIQRHVQQLQQQQQQDDVRGLAMQLHVQQLPVQQQFQGQQAVVQQQCQGQQLPVQQQFQGQQAVVQQQQAVVQQQQAVVQQLQAVVVQQQAAMQQLHWQQQHHLQPQPQQQQQQQQRQPSLLAPPSKRQCVQQQHVPAAACAAVRVMHLVQRSSGSSGCCLPYRPLEA